MRLRPGRLTREPTPSITISQPAVTEPGDAGIVIVGAGIAGLTLALELARIGLSCDIYERVPELEEAGAGIQLSPNALRVLDRLGLLERLKGVGTIARAVTLRSYRSGRPLATVPVVSGDGTPYLSVHRADLQAVLLEAIIASGKARLHLGRTLTRVEEATGAVRLSFTTADPKRYSRNVGHDETVEASLAIGADGVHSTVAALLDAGAVRTTDAVAWRGTVSLNTVHDIAHEQVGSSTGIEAWLGPERHAIAYPIAGGRRINLVLIEPAAPPAVQRQEPCADDPGTDEEIGKASARSARARLEALAVAGRFADWDPRLRRMIAATCEMAPWPLLVVPSDRAWRYLGNRVLLIGDAAHAMLPYAAQGAAMAIEDAAVLANRLAVAPETSHALTAYEAERRPRLERVAQRATFHRQIYHMRAPFRFGRDLVLASAPTEALSRSLGWLYDWSPDRSAS